MQAQDAEDVEDVVAVVGEGEGVDDGVEVNGGGGNDGPEGDDPGAGEKVLLAGLDVGLELGGGEVGGEEGEGGGEEVGEKDGEGEEGDVGPDVEHLGRVDGGDVVGFVAYWERCQCFLRGVWMEVVPRTTPPFQATNPPNRPTKAAYGAAA